METIRIEISPHLLKANKDEIVIKHDLSRAREEVSEIKYHFITNGSYIIENQML